MVIFYIVFGWFFFATIGLALYDLRPDKYTIYTQFRKIRESCKYKLTFPIMMFIYTPFSIFNSLKKIFEKDA